MTDVHAAIEPARMAAYWAERDLPRPESALQMCQFDPTAACQEEKVKLAAAVKNAEALEKEYARIYDLWRTILGDRPTREIYEKLEADKQKLAQIEEAEKAAEEARELAAETAVEAYTE